MEFIKNETPVSICFFGFAERPEITIFLVLPYRFQWFLIMWWPKGVTKAKMAGWTHWRDCSAFIGVLWTTAASSRAARRRWRNTAGIKSTNCYATCSMPILWIRYIRFWLWCTPLKNANKIYKRNYKHSYLFNEEETIMKLSFRIYGGANKSLVILNHFNMVFWCLQVCSEKSIVWFLNEFMVLMSYKMLLHTFRLYRYKAHS